MKKVTKKNNTVRADVIQLAVIKAAMEENPIGNRKNSGHTSYMLLASLEKAEKQLGKKRVNEIVNDQLNKLGVENKEAYSLK